MLLWLYNVIPFILFPFFIPFFLYKFIRNEKEWKERCGIVCAKGDILIHGASVGEARIIDSVIRATGLECVISIWTRMGRKVLEDSGYHPIYAPIDFFPFVKNLIKRVKPRSLILVEAELWPNLIFCARRSSARIFLINGRISSGRYISRLTRAILGQFTLILMQTEKDARRIIDIGADSSIVRVMGSIKYDGNQEKPPDFNIPNRKILVAGSIREGEEEILIKTFITVKREIENLYLIFAPRHLERVRVIENILRKQRVRFQKRSEKGEYSGEDVLILDTMGELASFYNLADVAFVGGTLLPFGGHNLLEPAFCGVPVVFGKHTENCEEMAFSLESNKGGIRVENEEELGFVMIKLLKNKNLLAEYGRNANLTAIEGGGSLKRTIEELKKYRAFDKLKNG